VEIEDNRKKINGLLDEFISHSKTVDREVHEVLENQGDLPMQLIRNIKAFIIHLTTHYNQYGCPVHVLEYAMPRVASGLGLKLDLAILPTFILVNH
jgi:hypothetical protein